MTDITETERERLRARGDTAYATSYPVRDCVDLAHAIRAYGRAPVKRRAELRRFLVRRKLELGCPDVQLPDTWHIVRGET